MNKKDKKSKPSRPEQASEASPEQDKKTMNELLMELSKLGVPMAPEKPPAPAWHSKKPGQTWREWWVAEGLELPHWVDGQPCPLEGFTWSYPMRMLWREVTPKKIVEASDSYGEWVSEF